MTGLRQEQSERDRRQGLDDDDDDDDDDDSIAHDAGGQSCSQHV